MKVVYIAGKYRGPNPWAVEQNVQAAQAVAAKVIVAGHMPLTPHLNTAHMEGLADDAFFLAGTMELLRRCDAVLCVSNWRDSVGARAEVEEARRLGLPVFGTGPDLTRGGVTALTMDAAIEDLCEWAEQADWLRPLISDITKRVAHLVGHPYDDLTVFAVNKEISEAIADRMDKCGPRAAGVFIGKP